MSNDLSGRISKAENDMFAMIIEWFGEPQNARRLALEEAVRYRGRVPEVLGLSKRRKK